MYLIGEDKKIKEFLDSLKNELPEESGYFINRFILNEYKSRRTLDKRTRSVRLDRIVELYEKSNAKYKKIFADIHGIGYVELTRRPDPGIPYKDIPEGHTMWFEKTGKQKKSSDDFIALYKERAYELQHGEESDIIIVMKGYQPIKITEKP